MKCMQLSNLSPRQVFVLAVIRGKIGVSCYIVLAAGVTNIALGNASWLTGPDTRRGVKQLLQKGK